MHVGKCFWWFASIFRFYEFQWKLLILRIIGEIGTDSISLRLIVCWVKNNWSGKELSDPSASLNSMTLKRTTIGSSILFVNKFVHHSDKLPWQVYASFRLLAYMQSPIISNEEILSIFSCIDEIALLSSAVLERFGVIMQDAKEGGSLSHCHIGPLFHVCYFLQFDVDLPEWPHAKDVWALFTILPELLQRP